MHKQHNASDISVYEKRVRENKGLNNTAKLTITDVREIRRRFAENKKLTLVDVAAQYNVSRKTIGAVVRGETWRDV